MGDQLYAPAALPPVPIVASARNRIPAVQLVAHNNSDRVVLKNIGTDSTSI
jgi:hypothetical protein